MITLHFLDDRKIHFSCVIAALGFCRDRGLTKYRIELHDFTVEEFLAKKGAL